MSEQVPINLSLDIKLSIEETEQLLAFLKSLPGIVWTQKAPYIYAWLSAWMFGGCDEIVITCRLARQAPDAVWGKRIWTRFEVSVGMLGNPEQLEATARAAKAKHERYRI